MTQFVCEICLNEFNEEDCIPKILPCGHSMCSTCLAQILLSSKRCPTCRSSLSLPDGTQYPTNFSLLVQPQPLDEHRGPPEIEKLLVTFRARKEILSRNVEALKLASDGLTRLEELKEQPKEIWGMDYVTSMLADLKASLRVIDKTLKLSHANPNPSLKLNFRNECHMFKEVRDRISDGEDFYSVLLINNMKRYGKISISSNMILIHSHTQFEIPGNAVTCWFHDLRGFFKEELVYAFVTLSTRNKNQPITLVIDEQRPMLNSDFKSKCTGEFGQVYKGRNYSVTLNDYGLLDSAKNKMAKNKVEDSSEEPKSNFVEGDILVCRSSNKALSICLYKDGNCQAEGVIGKVISGLFLEDITSTFLCFQRRVVQECGLAIIV